VLNRFARLIGHQTVANQQHLGAIHWSLSYIEGDALWPVFAKPDAKPRRERFRLLMRSLTAAAVPLARRGYEVLLDFSFPLDFLETARKIVKEIPLDLVILRPSIATCE
jgi:hypothetical protein